MAMKLPTAKRSVLLVVNNLDAPMNRTMQSRIEELGVCVPRMVEAKTIDTIAVSKYDGIAVAIEGIPNHEMQLIKRVERRGGVSPQVFRLTRRFYETEEWEALGRWCNEGQPHPRLRLVEQAPDPVESTTEASVQPDDGLALAESYARDLDTVTRERNRLRERVREMEATPTSVLRETEPDHKSRAEAAKLRESVAEQKKEIDRLRAENGVLREEIAAAVDAMSLHVSCENPRSRGALLTAVRHVLQQIEAPEWPDPFPVRSADRTGPRAKTSRGSTSSRSLEASGASRAQASAATHDLFELCVASVEAGLMSEAEAFERLRRVR